LAFVVILSFISFLANLGWSQILGTSDEDLFNPDPIKFSTNLEQALEKGNLEQKTIFIDFTEYTCVNCHWMEINVFSQVDIKKTPGK
jgi:thiol:disulfide interchange protein